jgi:autotransporter-associated beta strand protein
LTKTDEGTLTLSGANTYTGITTISGGTLQFAKLASLYNGTPANWTAAKLIVGSGATAVFNVGGTGEFTAANLDTLKSLGGASNGFTSGSFLGMDTTNAGGNFSYLSSIADPNGNVLGLTKSGLGSLTLSGASTYTGATTVSAGRLVVDGSITSATTVNSGGTLGGHGTVGAVTIKSGGVISPGNSPGTLTTGAEDWNGGGSYVWELNNASDAAGAKGVSYDWLNIGGALNLTASSGTPFTIYVTSLTSGNVAGVAPGFVFRASYQWIIASAGSIPTFSADMFRIDTSAFANDPANQGGFAIIQSGNDIVLTYTSVPEPKQWGVVFGLALGGFIFLRRRRIGRVGKS